MGGGQVHLRTGACRGQKSQSYSGHKLEVWVMEIKLRATAEQSAFFTTQLSLVPFLTQKLLML